MKKFFCFKVLLLGSIFFLTSNNTVFSQDITTKNEQVLQDATENLFQNYKKILVEKAWNVTSEANHLHASQIITDFHALDVTVDIKTTERYHIFSVHVTKDERTYFNQFTFIRNENFSNEKVTRTILPFLLVPVVEKKQGTDYRRYYYADIALGYSRVHDNREIYPEYQEGSVFINGSLLYDPTRIAKNEKATISAGDYFLFDLRLDFCSPLKSSNRPFPISEIFFDINLVLYGTHDNHFDGETEKRYLYGFFTGIEFFKPGLGANILDTGYDPKALRWDAPVYDEQVHLQYFIWRALQYQFMYSSKKDLDYSFLLMASVGFSINSSLVATGITEDQEDDLSDIFKSEPERKENYYNSYVVPLRADFSIDNFYDFRFGVGYKFYYFFPMEKEEAYDILHIASASIGYYITKEVCFNITYEYWKIYSKLEDEKKDHFWNKLGCEIRYTL